MARLTVQLVIWNGQKYIPHLFESLKKQTFRDWKLLVLDNASSDGTAEVVRNQIGNFPVEVDLVESSENTGFAGGHNVLFKRESESAYVLLLNQDMYLSDNCFENMVAFLDKHADAAGVSPRLMRWDFEKSGELQKNFTNQIDAIGLKVFRNRRAVEWLTREVWEERSPNTGVAKLYGHTHVEVFGLSGAFPMFRRSDLNSAALGEGNIFDGSYVLYKEDLDLAYRLRSQGKKSFVLLDTVAYHDRTGAGPREMGDGAALKNKLEQKEWVKYHSYKNHLRTLRKNEYWQNTLIDLPWILLYELKKLVWFLLFDRKVLTGVGEVFKLRKKTRESARHIKRSRIITWRDMRKWWT